MKKDVKLSYNEEERGGQEAKAPLVRWGKLVEFVWCKPDLFKPVAKHNNFIFG